MFEVICLYVQWKTRVLFFISQDNFTFAERATIQNSVISLISCLYTDGERSLLSTFYTEHVGIKFYRDEQDAKIGPRDEHAMKDLTHISIIPKKALYCPLNVVGITG